MPVVRPGRFGGRTFPFDDLGDGLIAYSIRQVSESYSGPLVELYRPSSLSSMDFGFGSDGELDYDAIDDWRVNVFESDYSTASHDWVDHIDTGFTYTSNVDSIGGEDDWMELDKSGTGDGTSRLDLSVIAPGADADISLKVYCPASTGVTAIQSWFGGGYVGPDSGTIADDTVVTLTWTGRENAANDGAFYLRVSGGAGPIYVKDIVITSGQELKVRTLYDQGSLGHDFQKTTATNMPLFHDGTDFISGMEFNNGQVLSPVSGDLASSISSNHSVYAVVEGKTAHNGHKGVCSFNGMMLLESTVGTTWGTYTGPSADTDVLAGELSLLGMNRAGGGTGTYRLNGADDGNYTSTSGQGSGHIGGQGGQFLEGRICEILVWDVDKSADQATIEAYMNDRFSIY